MDSNFAHTLLALIGLGQALLLALIAVSLLRMMRQSDRHFEAVVRLVFREAEDIKALLRGQPQH